MSNGTKDCRLGVHLVRHDGKLYVCLTDDGEPVFLLPRDAANTVAENIKIAASELAKRELS